MLSDNNVKNYIVDSKNVENIDNGDISTTENKGISNLIPLKPDSELTPEEIQRKHDIVVAGGKARAEQRRQQRSMKESAKILLNMSVSKGLAKQTLGKDADISGIETMQDLLIARMIREALENGNTKAAEFIRDTSGNKPTAELEITADIVTAADKALIDKVANRLGMVDITDENND